MKTCPPAEQRQVIWVFGISAAGKETFARTLSQDPALWQRLGFVAKPALVEPSVAFIGQYRGDPTALKREQTLNRAAVLLGRHAAVVAKWQLVDSVAGRPERLKDLLECVYPGTRHTIVELRAGDEEAAVRLEDKPWWPAVGNPGEEPAHVAEELTKVAAAIAELQPNFEHIVLDSAAGSDYSRIA